MRSIVAEGLEATSSGGAFHFSRPVYVGRGIPDAWLVVTFTLSGAWPDGAVLLQLPSFRSAGVSNVQGGTFDAAASTITVTPGSPQVVVTLGS